MRSLRILLVIQMAVLCTACGNTIAKNFGGTTTYDLDPGKKLVNVSWKDDSLWIVQTARDPSEKPKSYEYIQKTNSNLITGKVIINEK